VYWTLAVECQYYLAIAVLFPLVMGGTIGRRLVTVAALP